MNEIDFSRSVVHDSARYEYRQPLGAVPEKTKITLYLDIFEMSVGEVYLVAMHEDETTEEIRMTLKDMRWTAELDTPDKPCVIRYWFVIKIDSHNKIYYGAGTDFKSGVGMVYWSTPPAFDIVIYDSLYRTPNWLKNSIMYQIFPDRFARGNEEKMKEGLEYHRSLGREVTYHEDWEEEPVYTSKNYNPCDYFGGDLQGIINHLDYLRDIGIDMIWLNPIFEAASNHRYNTSDYKKIDPVLGDNEDFIRLIKEAEHRGIKVMLDGDFSHTGDDSIYFNKYGRYDDLGAHQSPDSEYYSWYKFTDYPDGYKSWWGFMNLPEVNVNEPTWNEYIIDGEDSVIKHWLKKGAVGFRLDVADELPDHIIEKMRGELKSMSQDNILIGEVWDIATMRDDYEHVRKYTLGQGLDSVMNYLLTQEIIHFLTSHKDADNLRRFLVDQSQYCPKEMYYSLMNLLSSHDISRIHTVLATGINPSELSREQQAVFKVTEKQAERGVRLQKIAAAIQFTLPGVPCIYYGDETGADGLMDPFNRKTFRKQQNEQMQEYYSMLCRLRKAHAAFRTGNCLFYSRGKDLFGILRFCLRQQDAFGNVADDGMFITLANRSARAQKVAVDFYKNEQLLLPQQYEHFKDVNFTEAICLETGQTFRINDGLLEIKLEPESVGIFEILWT